METLATGIATAIQDKGIRDRAAALGEKIRSENGVAQAVEIIEKTMNIMRKSNIA